MRIGIASDHRGYKIKQKIIKYLEKKGYTIVDCGTSSEQPTDYPDYGISLGERLINNDFSYGIAVCGTGIGISIACNKVKGIRCAKVDNIKETKLSRKHNDANIIAFNACKPFFEIKDLLDTFLKTTFSQEERHIRRLNKISVYESEKCKK